MLYPHWRDVSPSGSWCPGLTDRHLSKSWSKASSLDLAVKLSQEVEHWGSHRTSTLICPWLADRSQRGWPCSAQLIPEPLESFGSRVRRDAQPRLTCKGRLAQGWAWETNSRRGNPFEWADPLYLLLWATYPLLLWLQAHPRPQANLSCQARLQR
jgi:hypothetical protein